MPETPVLDGLEGVYRSSGPPFAGWRFREKHTTRMFLRGLGSRVLELGGESGTDRHPTVYPGSYVEYVQKLGHEAPGIYS